MFVIKFCYKFINFAIKTNSLKKATNSKWENQVSSRRLLASLKTVMLSFLNKSLWVQFHKAKRKKYKYTLFEVIYFYSSWDLKFTQSWPRTLLVFLGLYGSMRPWKPPKPHKKIIDQKLFTQVFHDSFRIWWFLGEDFINWGSFSKFCLFEHLWHIKSSEITKSSPIQIFMGVSIKETL